MTIEMYPSDQVADLRAEVTHWYENLQKDQLSQQAQLQEFGQTSRQQDFPGTCTQKTDNCDSIASEPQIEHPQTLTV